MPKYNISASIVSYGGFDDVKKCVESLIAYTKNSNLTIYIIDNNSVDDTPQKLASEYQNVENVNLMLLSKNIGFGKGHNSCIQNLTSDFHAVVNPDIIIDTDVLTALADFLNNNKECSIVTPKLKFLNGETQYVAKRKPSLMALLSRQLPFKFLKKYEDYYLMRDMDLDKITEVQFCSGCFFMMPTKHFKQIQGFDKSYFMYVEDADITQKALQVGTAYFNPECYVYHAWNRQTKRSIKHFFMQIKSMMIYFKKWGFCIGLKNYAKQKERG